MSGAETQRGGNNCEPSAVAIAAERVRESIGEVTIQCPLLYRCPNPIAHEDQGHAEF